MGGNSAETGAGAMGGLVAPFFVQNVQQGRGRGTGPWLEGSVRPRKGFCKGEVWGPKRVWNTSASQANLYCQMCDNPQGTQDGDLPGCTRLRSQAHPGLPPCVTHSVCVTADSASSGTCWGNFLHRFTSSSVGSSISGTVTKGSIFEAGIS